MLLDKRRVSSFTRVGAIVLAVAFIGSLISYALPSLRGDLSSNSQNADLDTTRQQLLADTKAYEQSLKMYPKIGRNWAALGETYVKLAQVEGEAKAPQKALKYWSKSTEAFQKAIKLLPRNLASRVQLAFGFIQTGRPTQALQQLAVADRIKPNDANVYFGLGLAYQGVGKKAKAIDALKRFLKLEPKTDRAKYAQQVLAQLQGTTPPATPGAPATGTGQGTGAETRSPLQIPSSGP